MKYFEYDSNGNITAIYAKDVNPQVSGDTLPDNVIEVEEAQWIIYLNDQSSWTVDVQQKALIEKPPISNDELLAIAKTKKIFEIDNDCKKAIISGFESSALGSSYRYDSTLEDQTNLIGAASLNVDIDYACYDTNNIKAFRPHTVAQLKQVLIDGLQVKLQCLVKARELKDQVGTVDTISEVNAIVWS